MAISHPSCGWLHANHISSNTKTRVHTTLSFSVSLCLCVLFGGVRTWAAHNSNNFGLDWECENERVNDGNQTQRSVYLVHLCAIARTRAQQLPKETKNIYYNYNAVIISLFSFFFFFDSYSYSLLFFGLFPCFLGISPSFLNHFAVDFFN